MSTPFCTINLNSLKQDIKTNTSNILVSEQALANLDGEAVKKTGDQTISGEKTFSNKIIASSLGMQFTDNTSITSAFVSGMSAFQPTTQTSLYGVGDPYYFSDAQFSIGGTLYNNSTVGTVFQVGKTGYYLVSCFVRVDCAASMFFQIMRHPLVGSITKIGGAAGFADRLVTSTGRQSASDARVVYLLEGDEIYVDNQTANVKMKGSGSTPPNVLNGFSIMLLRI